jgi:RNA 2',3'-cyclic 3'-phosphodiesterase
MSEEVRTSEFKRLFVGVRVSVPTANALSSAAETLARRAREAGVEVRWVAPVSYHVTLGFLGNTRVDAITAITDALDEAARGTKEFKLKASRLGAFPSLDKPRVIWAGVEDQSGELVALASRVAEAMHRLGHGDRTPFHPHVTIGRIKELPPKLSSLKEVVLPLAEQMFGDTRVDAITLVESETKSTGSVYRDVHRAAFKTAVSDRPESGKRQSEALPLGAPGEPVSIDRETDDGWPRGHDS